MAASSWEWLNNEFTALARFVDPALYEGRADLIPADIFTLNLRADRAPAVEALYELLRAKRLNYDVDPRYLAKQFADPAVRAQYVRQPCQVFDGAKATCLDLALVFCGMCENAGLRPLLAVASFQGRASSHALVLVAPTLGAGDHDDLAGSAPVGSLPAQGWLAVDVTAATRYGDDPDRPHGFQRATADAVTLLGQAQEVRLLDVAYQHANGMAPDPGTRPLTPAAAQVFAADVRSRYQDALLAAGLPVPQVWDLQELGRLSREHRRRAPGRSKAGDLLDALLDALTALPLFERAGGTEIGIVALQYLYLRHVGRWPDAGTRETLLVEAASARVAELHTVGGPAEPLTALARFLLGVTAQDPAGPAEEQPYWAALAAWLTGTLQHQLQDVRAYLASHKALRAWALIDLMAQEGEPRKWPTRIVVDVVREDGSEDTYGVDCAVRSQEELRDALGTAVAGLCDESELCVDLAMPQSWLDAGLECLEVIDTGVGREALNDVYDPRLRWRLFLNHPVQRVRLRKRLALLNWGCAALPVPTGAARDVHALTAWLRPLELDHRHPPYFTVTADPTALRTLLLGGCGFLVAFPPDTPDQAQRDAQTMGDGRDQGYRRNQLPSDIASGLRDHHPVIVWNDPGGRAGLPLPKRLLCQPEPL